MPIREIAARDRRHDFHDVQPRPHQRNPERREADVVQSQQQKRIARVAEAEQEDDRHRPLETPRRRNLKNLRNPRNPRNLGNHGNPGNRGNLGNLSKVCAGNPQQNQDDDDARDDGQGEERAILVGVEEEEERREQRAGDGAGVVHGAVETVDAAADRRGREVGQHRVARRAADALAEAIGEAQRQHLRPRRHQRDERPHRAGDRVARHDDWLGFAGAIGQPAGGNLEDAVRRLCRALDDAERHRAGAEHARQEERQQRIDHLGRRVGDEADPAEQPDGTRKPNRSSGLPDGSEP